MSIKTGGALSRMRRYPAQGWVAGVCAGLAEYFDWNVKLVRAIFGVCFLFSGFFPVGLIYCVLWYVLDEAPGVPPARASAYDTPYTPGSETHGATVTDVKVRFARLEERLRSMEACVTSKDFELRRELRKLES